jgi:two-component system, chemotaxis family, sensor kinase CheA
VILLRELGKLGRTEITPDPSHLPALDRMDPGLCYLSWSILLDTDQPRAAIEEVFEFVADDVAEVTISPTAPTAPPSPVPQPMADSPPHPPALAEQGAVAETVAHGPIQTTSIRVELDKIDRLVNMVGELVITQAMLSQQTAAFSVESHPELIQGLQELSHHTRDLQESVMAIRAQPIKALFSRAPRLVRDLAAKLGKQARLVMSGENTEVDKTVIEHLSDPLIHLIRNAIDHGIEPAEERLSRGKPAEGTISLDAQHRSGRIVIEIGDDGRGIDRARLFDKAAARGLVERAAPLSEEQIDALVFAPGLTTASQVTDVSGRGVGMDVVRKNIQDIGGRVTVQSQPGHGTRFILSLPLTLAVMDGMLVAVGRERYVLPLTNIVESLRPTAQQARSLVEVGTVLVLRGQYIPLVPLHRVFDVADAVTDPTRGLVVVVETEGEERIGLLVDELLGQQQVVIKSLDANYRPVRGISAATILGDGRVALILDVGLLRDMAAGTGATAATPVPPPQPPLLRLPAPTPQE